MRGHHRRPGRCRAWSIASGARQRAGGVSPARAGSGAAGPAQSPKLLCASAKPCAGVMSPVSTRMALSGRNRCCVQLRQVAALDASPARPACRRARGRRRRRRTPARRRSRPARPAAVGHAQAVQRLRRAARSSSSAAKAGWRTTSAMIARACGSFGVVTLMSTASFRPSRAAASASRPGSRSGGDLLARACRSVPSVSSAGEIGRAGQRLRVGPAAGLHGQVGGDQRQVGRAGDDHPQAVGQRLLGGLRQAARCRARRSAAASGAAASRQRQRWTAPA